MDWIVSPPRFLCWSLDPSAMVTGGGAFRRWWGLYDPMMGLVFSALSWPREDTVRRQVSASQVESSHPGLNLQAPWSWTSSLQNYEKQTPVVLFKLPQSVELCCGSLSRLRGLGINSVPSATRESIKWCRCSQICFMIEITSLLSWKMHSCNDSHVVYYLHLRCSEHMRIWSPGSILHREFTTTKT